MLNIQTGISAVLKQHKKVYPVHVNRVSSMGHPCLRYLYYCRTAWDKKTPVEDGLQGIFNTGNILEPQIEKIVIDIGLASTPRWRIVGAQVATNDKLLKEYQIAGTIDGFLQIETIDSATNLYWRTVGVIDIKTSNPNIFSRIYDVASLDNYSWTKKYIAQLMLYALAHNLEHCFILFVNKSNLYDMKMVDFPLDMGYAESLLQKAAEVNLAIDCEEPPKKLNQPDNCTRCEFSALCMPELKLGEGFEMTESPELAELLEERKALQESKKEYDRVEKKINGMLVKGKNIVCGNFYITWKESARKGYVVKPTTMFRKTISGIEVYLNQVKERMAKGLLK